MPQAVPFNVLAGASAVDKSVQKYFLKESTPELQLKKYFNFRTTTDYYDKDAGISGLSEASFTTENANIKKDVPVETYKKTYTQEQIDISAPFSYVAWKFAIKKRDVTNINNVVYDGTTYSLPFDYAGLKAAQRTASLFVDPRGNPYPADLDTLVCKKGSSVHFKAMEILAAIKKGMIPESTDHDGSAISPFKIIALDYLTSDVYWFMFDSSRALSGGSEGFWFIESEANNIDPVHINPYNRELTWFGHSLCALGHNDVTRSWVASAGDSATT